jgi:pentatricopeptide repeat protein
MDIFQSLMSEMFVLLIFFVTWIATTKFLTKKKQPLGKKGAVPDDPAEVIELIQEYSGDQFSRAFRLYKDLMKRNQDKTIKTEEFYQTLIDGAIRTSQADASLVVLQRMMDLGWTPSTTLLQNTLRLLCARKFYATCIKIATIVDPAMDTIVYSCLTQASGEINDIEACKIFLAKREKYETEEGGLKAREYLPLLRSYARQKNMDASYALWKWFVATKPEIDTLVVNTVLSAGCRSDPNILCSVLAEVRACPKCTVDIVTFNTVLKCLGRHRNVTACFSLLEDIRAAEIAPDDVTFSTLLDVCIEEKEHQLAQVALEQMLEADVKLNCVLLTTLMKGFVRTRRLDMAMRLYRSMYERESESKPDMVTYSLLIKAHCDAQDMSTALSIFEDMLQYGCKVDDVVFTHLIEGCCHVSNPALAEKLFQDMLAAYISPTIYTMTALVKVYGKCGHSEQAMELVRTMEKVYGVKPTVVISTCLISGLLRQKKLQEAYACFQQMKEDGCEPDQQCVQTIVQGLTDGQMFDEVNSVVAGAVERRLPLKPEGVNQALSQMLAKGELAKGRELHKLMQFARIPVTSVSVERRLKLGL